ncbi:zinc-binding alcohol dehydrogenase family protein [Amphritea sp. 2_MG-2023]|uniref:zinc-binding alcohol dehydrogenase family protein n=1 Tax=Amphritea TaxID=515417 RepID=UPI001C070269|nr:MULTISPECIES: zinc-binding alcohol dehydrogenase family protein [Amphritea]MBU2965943.1 zinc-binding alcohol dehydrogenase family protein [Amphritea atlantica]MDO6418033.1 zinc-binding alcohol dehydrogenase family protein [Amphritea sp. 2_MG-2023]
MKAIGYQTPGSIDRQEALVDISLDQPIPQGQDLRVKIQAVSVNPVDYKVRQGMPAPEGGWNVLGYDASGVVDAVGDAVQNFQVGDQVFYAGSMIRPGTNSEYHLVDERIVAKKPTSLSHAEAAAMPLTSITAWEALFDRLDVTRPTTQGGKLILIIGGAGGVGSIAIQLLRALTDMTIITTVSRPETQAWVEELGAHHVIDHSKPMAPQIDALGLGAPGFVFSTNHSQHHLADIAELIAPQGRFSLTDEVDAFDSRPFVMKSISVHFELMFTRSLFGTSDIAAQHQLLSKVAELIDAGKIKTTLTEIAGLINADNLKKVHAQLETGKARGKIVLEGF